MMSAQEIPDPDQVIGASLVSSDRFIYHFTDIKHFHYRTKLDLLSIIAYLTVP